MLDKGNFNIGSVTVIEKGPIKRSTSKGKPFIKSSCGEYCTYCKRLGHTKDTYYKLYGKEKILDSRTTNHMTSFPSYFTSYLKVSKKQLITIANGDHVPIAESGNVQLHSFLSLHNVLHVPKLANNLISIHRLKDWNWAMTFFRSHCDHELTIGRTIGIAKVQDGLYYLQHTKIGNNTSKK
ncbi:hypothetical protein CR513_42985, partial [Mucuna pruriens]